MGKWSFFLYFGTIINMFFCLSNVVLNVFLIFSRCIMKCFFDSISMTVTTTGCNFAGRTSIKQRLSLIPGFTLFSSPTCTSIRVIFLQIGLVLFSNSAENKLLLFDVLLHFVCVKLYFHSLLY
jgi:hypothetical protein